MYEIWDCLATCSLLESCTPEGWIIFDVRDLQDSGENSVEAIKFKIAMAANLLASGNKVCIRCLAGMSRSNTIACACMMMINLDHTWNYYWHRVEKKCPRARQNLPFVDLVKKALVELGVEKKRVYYAENKE